MHELLLFGQVPAARHAHLLKVLAGVAGMQSQRVLERHLIYRPKGKPGLSVPHVGGSQGIQTQQAQALQGQMQGELFYLQLVGDLDPAAFPLAVGAAVQEVASDSVMRDVDAADGAHGKAPAAEEPGVQQHKAYAIDGQAWSMRFSDLPEVAGRRPVTSRLISSADIVDGDALRFMDAFGYRCVCAVSTLRGRADAHSYVSEYLLEGHRVVHNNAVLLLHRVLRFPASDGGDPQPRQTLPPYADLTPLDLSGAWVLQASLRVQDGNKPESMTLGIDELKALKDTLRGVVDLEVGDRLALDTRYR